MELIDSHCHIQVLNDLNQPDHTAELWRKSNLTANQVLKSASKAHIVSLICVGCNLRDSQDAIKFAFQYRNCFASVGIHPHEAEVFMAQLSNQQQFNSLPKQQNVVAIGECGLDYFYNYSPRDDQIKALHYQLELAERHNLPVIFHVREAFKDFWPIYDSHPNIKGVLHSFTDSQAELEKGLIRGLYFGVNGIATFTKNPAQLEMFKAIPNDRLLLETDAPYLTPSPYRGSINEPKHVLTVLQFLSKLKVLDEMDLAKQTTANTKKLFVI